MRAVVVWGASALLAGCAVEVAGPPAPAPVSRIWLTLDAADVPLVHQAVAERDVGAFVHPARIDGDVAIVEVDERDVARLSELVHEQRHRCGGFMAHASVIDAEAAVRASRVDHAALLAVDYSIDNAEVTETLIDAVEELEIRQVIQALSAFPNRYYTSASGAESSRWLRDHWTSLADGRADVSVELYDHGYPQASVIMTIEGTAHPDELVIVGAHLDSIAAGGASSTAPGADDDASGVATMTEAARVMMETGFRPERTIQLMAYAAEEVGLRGSQDIAQQYRADGVDVVGVLQLDMTNYKGSPQDIWLIQDFTNAPQNAFLSDLIDRYLEVSQSTARCGYGCSDHASWHRAGFAASIPFEASLSASNPTIHTSGDRLSVSGGTAEHAVSFARLTAAYLAELAKGRLATGGDNAAPTLAILAPADGAIVPEGAAVTLIAHAADLEDGELSSEVVWRSSRDGALGTGASRSVVLSLGEHVLAGSVTDSAGATAEESVLVRVASAGGEGFVERFDAPVSDWQTGGLWHRVVDTPCASPGYASPRGAMYYGRDAACDYDTGARTSGDLTSPTIDGITTSSTLRFSYLREVEHYQGDYDVIAVSVIAGGRATTVFRRTSSEASTGAWRSSSAISLAAFAGQSIRLRFRFDSRDGVDNAFAGWLVDDVIVE